jgi:hypothetical protein
MMSSFGHPTERRGCSLFEALHRHAPIAVGPVDLASGRHVPVSVRVAT